MIIYILLGLVGVSNMILWGVYGDLMAEVFEWKKVLRSVLLAVVYGSVIFLVNSKLPWIIVLLTVISLERVTTEIYKAFFRNEKQDKYLIPSDLNLKFNPMIRVLVGVISLGVVWGLVFFLNTRVNNLLLALVSGFIVALGGMGKDAPYEGFDPIKFFRSPGVALVIGLLLYLRFGDITNNFFVLAVLGGERIVSECYKKIIRGKVPGKFKAHSFPEWKEKRKILLIPYALSLILIVVIYFAS